MGVGAIGAFGGTASYLRGAVEPLPLHLQALSLLAWILLTVYVDIFYLK
jgi:hypothetical protein